MAVNPGSNKQAVELLFSHKIKSIYHLPIYFNGVEIIMASDQKHLGLVLDSKLSFSAHVNESQLEC